MTVREGAVLSAYTGHTLCSMKALCDYVESILGRPVTEAELPSLSREIRAAAADEAKKIIEQQC